MQTKEQQEFQVDIQSLKLIRDGLQEEIKNLHYARTNLTNQVNGINKQIGDLNTLHKIASIRQADVRKEEDIRRETRLYNLEKNLEVVQRQLGDRDQAITARESRVSDLEHQADVMRLESLEIEKMKIQLKREMAALETSRYEVENRIAIAKSHEENATSKLKEAKRYRDEMIMTDIRVQDQMKALVLKERSVAQATEALEKQITGTVTPSVEPVAEPIAVPVAPDLEAKVEPEVSISAPVVITKRRGRPRLERSNE